MTDINANMLNVIICIVLATFISCTSIFNDAVDDTVDSLEDSNKVLIDSNLKMYDDIKAAKVPDSIKIIADSLLYANEGVNALIDQFKEEISNLTLVGRGSEHAQQIFTSPYSFAALTYELSNVDARTSVIMNDSTRKLTLDSVLATIRSMSTDSLWLKKHVEGSQTNRIVLLLSEFQTSSSTATNLALRELRQ